MMATLDDLLWSYQSLIYGLGTNAILGLSMYAVLQLGQLSLGQAAFMGIGAYTGALLTLRLGLVRWICTLRHGAGIEQIFDKGDHLCKRVVI